jgi:hypothetical protein
LSDAKKSGMKDELQKLVSEWPFEVLKHKEEEERKVYRILSHCEEILVFTF